MSALDSPLCGRAAASFPSRKTMGRLAIASGLGATVPRSGQYTIGVGVGAGVAVGTAVTVAVGVSVGDVPVHAEMTATRKSVENRTSGRTRMSLPTIRVADLVKLLAEKSRDLARCLRHRDPRLAERLDLRPGRSLPTGHDRAGVAHALARRRREAGDERDGRLAALRAQICRGLLLVGAADLADDDERPRLAIFVEEPHRVRHRQSDDRIAADADAGGLSETLARQEVGDLVCERAAPRDEPDGARRERVDREDADLALARRDDARAVRSDERRRRARQSGGDAQHVVDRDPLGDGDDERELRVERLQDRVRGGGRGHEDDRRIRIRRDERVADGVVDGDAVDLGTAGARLHAPDDVRPVLLHLPGVEAALAADALDDDARPLVDEDAHAAVRAAFAILTASAAASSMVASLMSGLPARRARPSFARVPESRTTSGTRGFTSARTSRMPFATSSPRVMPPKMLMSTLRTRSSERTISSAAFTTSSFAPPPMSRKFAASPPASLTASSVPMTSPAPFPMIPTLPSRRT